MSGKVTHQPSGTTTRKRSLSIKPTSAGSQGVVSARTASPVKAATRKKASALKTGTARKGAAKKALSKKKALSGATRKTSAASKKTATRKPSGTVSGNKKTAPGKKTSRKTAKKVSKKVTNKRAGKKASTSGSRKPKATTAKARKNENKTTQNTGAPHAYLAGVEPESRRRDAQFLLTWFQSVTGLDPVMWGSSIIGFGRYHYRYDSGREGDSLITGYSARKTALTLYIMPGYRDLQDKLDRLGKHKIGKSCLYIKSLEDIDLDVLEEIVLDGIEYMRANYETWDR